MILAEGEHIVKSWDYAQIKEKKLIGGRKSELSLTVTNKRVISTVSGNRGISRDEVYIEEVTSVSTHTSLPSILGPVLLILLGVMFIILGFVFNSDSSGGTTLAICLATGILFIITAAILLSRTGFELMITAKGGAPVIWTGATSLKGSHRARAIKVRVDRSVVYRIQDELGAIILNIKNSSKAISENKSDEAV